MTSPFLKEYKSYHGIYKIIVIGSSGTGKTSFVRRWTKNKFDNNYQVTLAADREIRVISKGKSLYQIAIWDLPGMDHNPHLTKIFAKDAQGCIILADVTNKQSLQDTIKWKKELDMQVLFPDHQPIPSVLVENKIDVLSEIEQRDMQNVARFAKKNGFDAAFRVSVKEGKNVEQVMEWLIDNIIDRMKSIKDVENSLVRNEHNKFLKQTKGSIYEKENKMTKCC
jgi:small GTP-binding protein